MIVVLVATLADEMACRVAASLGLDVEILLARDDGADHCVIVADADKGMVCIPCDASKAAELVAEYITSGLLAPGSLLPPPPAVQALLRTH